MESLGFLLSGFAVAFQPINMLFCLIGVLLGTLVGVLPGLGPVGAIGILLSTTFNLDPIGAIIMLAGIYYGAMYGGSTTAILINIPGEVACVVTCLDGHQMAKQGRAGAALGISAFGSFIAGIIGMMILVFLAPPLANFALKFGPTEYFSLMFLGFSIITYLSSGSMLKAFIMVLFGMFIGIVGTDPISGRERFTMDLDILRDGIGLVPIIMGFFGLGEVFTNLETEIKSKKITEKVSNLLPTLKDWRDSIWPIIRGSFLGFFLGILPGGGAMLSSFLSYGMEKKLSRTPEKFGKGAIAGVAGPETANNAGAIGAFTPMLSMGIPSNAVTAILLGALIIHGIEPGPLLILQHPDLFWGVIASMLMGNIFLIILNLPLIGLWVKLLKVPYHILFPIIILFCVVGVYTINYRIDDILVMLVFGLVGWCSKKFDFEGAPFILALVLGPMMEKALRQSLILSDGKISVFFTRPISAILISIAVFIMISPLFPWLKRKPLPSDD